MGVSIDMSRYMYLSIFEEERMAKVTAALNAKVRRDILRLVVQNSYNITEIAKILQIPVSTVAFHVNNLQEADLVNVQIKSAIRGSSKIISRKIDEITVRCVDVCKSENEATTVLNIPIGSFTDCHVSPSCGMANETNIIEMDDTPGVFFSTARNSAQIIWFASGYLEYRLPNYFLKGKEPLGMSFSLELCSEAPNYRNEWESDITFCINGTDVCTWTSPGDFGGHRGQLNPEWWPDISSQYGLLKTVRINGRGTYLDENKMSAVCLKDLHIDQGDFITLRIGNNPDAVNIGGVNLFGEKFGNYQQNILVRFGYREGEEQK